VKTLVVVISKRLSRFVEVSSHLLMVLQIAVSLTVGLQILHQNHNQKSMMIYEESLFFMINNPVKLEELMKMAALVVIP